MSTTNRIGHARKMALACKAHVSIPTINKALRGEPIRGDAGDRAREVLAAEGLAPRHDSTNPPPHRAAS